MEINISQGAITSLVDKLSEKIFTEDNSVKQEGPFKVHFNKKICRRLREVVFNGLLSRQDEERGFPEAEKSFNVKERLCIVVYRLKAFGLSSKANQLEKLISSLEFVSGQSSVYTGKLDVINEVPAVIEILLALSNEANMLTHDPCEVWRKVDSCFQISLNDQTSLSIDSGIIGDNEINIDYQYFPSQIFEASPTFGIPRHGFESDGDSVQFNIFSQAPGSCGLIKWFGPKANDLFRERTRSSLYSALIHSRASDMEVKLELPELPSQQDFRLKPIHSPLITEDEGFEDASDELSTSSMLSEDSGTHGLEIWDEALRIKPSRFFTWEGRKQKNFKACKPYFTEAGPEVINFLCDMRIAEASFLINNKPEQLRYLEMDEFIRDSLMVLIGVPSQTFQLEKSTGSFHVSTIVRLSGCSPESFQTALAELAEIGTNYFRLNKFTSCQRHVTLIRSSVLRSFMTGLKSCLQKYRQSVITVEASRLQSVFHLCTKFREQAHELRFLSDICMCSRGFVAEYGKPKPKFPAGAKLLSYLYELCLRNMNSGVISLLLYLLKVSCTPYLRFIHQWVFKGKCIDFYKEFMIFENDVYLAHRDKHYWTHGYVMSGTDKMDGVPVFLKDLSKDMFICGKSINLLKLCCPEHFICNHTVEMPVVRVVYSLSSLQCVSDSSREYAEKMRKLQESIQLEWRRKKNEEQHTREELVISERHKASRALAEIEELIQKAKKALAEKKKEELNSLKKQMEDAIKRKELERKQVDEEDARLVKESLRYEVTTAKIDDEFAEQARQELIHYYEELSKEAERREKRALWLASRYALKNERDTFLDKEKDKLDEMRKEISQKLAKAPTRKMWAVADKNEPSDNNSSSVQDLIYHSDTAVDSQLRRTLPRIGQAMQSTAQDIMYPDIPSSTDGDSQISRDSKRGHIRVTKATDSTVQDLMYPTSREEMVSGIDTTADDNNGDSTVSHSTATSDFHGTKTLTRAMDSTVQNLIYNSSEDGMTTTPTTGGRPLTRAMDSTAQNLLYHSSEEGMVAQPTSSTDGTVTRAMDSTAQNLIYHDNQEMVVASDVSQTGDRSMTRALDSTVQNLMYHSSEEQVVPYQSTRGVGSAFQSTVQEQMYGGDVGTVTMSSRRFEPSGEMKNVLYGDNLSGDSLATTSRRSEKPSVMKDILYPSANHSNDGQMKSTRGSAPESTIQNLMYRSASITEEPEQPERQQLTHEDVWLDTRFESLPDNFDMLNDEPFGDIFVRVMLGHTGSYHESHGLLDDSLDGENDACDILCLPVILQRCVIEPLTTQIEVVNSAVVRYFMDNLRLVAHFETLKKFLLMEDGEFSYSLTQQLFEKISSGATPEQLCCISTLNSIMAQSIQSSVYACQSENTRSLSFVLKSIPHMFQRTDVKVLDFIELRYKIEWPVNIVITENCITKYNRIFAFMLRLKRTAWILQDIRCTLKRMDKCASKSPQLRKIHLFRHEMSHFVNDVQGYVSNQILHVSWQEFLNSLEHNVRNLDDLHDCHAAYINKSLFRALLNKKAAPVMKIITDLFSKVLKFHTQLVSSSWTVEPKSGVAVHTAFHLLSETYESFKESTCFLLTVITKLVNRGYQPHLEELLLRLNFNSYYGKNISNQNSPIFEV